MKNNLGLQVNNFFESRKDDFDLALNQNLKSSNQGHSVKGFLFKNSISGIWYNASCSVVCFLGMEKDKLV